MVMSYSSEVLVWLVDSRQSAINVFWLNTPHTICEFPMSMARNSMIVLNLKFDLSISGYCKSALI